MKALLTVEVLTTSGRFIGEIRNNRVAREIRNDTFRSFMYWSLDKLQLYAKSHGWQVTLSSEPIND